MVEADKPRFEECVKSLSAIHRTGVSNVLLRAYWDALIEMPIASFNTAYQHLLKHAKWMPKPAEFWAATKMGWM